MNANNYEEWLLLYTDNELTAEQKITVEKFAAGHPAIQEELELLQKTKFQPEQVIVFHNKELLYRKEEKVRVIAISWRRIAVAAALLIAVSTIVVIQFNKKGGSIEGGFTTIEPTSIKPTVKNPADQQTGVASNTNTIATENNDNRTGKDEAVINAQVAATNKRTIAPKEKNVRSSVLPIKEDAPVVADNNSVKKKTNDLPKPTYNPNVDDRIERNNPFAKNDLPAKEPLTNLTENIQPSNVTPGNSQSLKDVVTAASVESIDPADAEPGKKNKLRGFFRKVTRTFEKTTNIKATDDEDRLLLGGLAIKL